MKPSQIRAELLEQHAGLRGLIAATRAELARWGHGEPARDEVRRAIARLAAAVREHNHSEEELLHDVIREVDAWGAVRAELMNEEHVKEHQELYAALLDADVGRDVQTTGPAIARVLSGMEDHMAREENALLAEDVLRDDVVVIDSLGG